jgi:hypothetical protein
MPFSYNSTDLNQRDPSSIENAAAMALMSDFVDRFKTKLVEYNVKISLDHAQYVPGEYLASGIYRAPHHGQSCFAYAVSVYNSGAELEKVQISFQGSGDCRGNRTFDCAEIEGLATCSTKAGSEITNVGSGRFTYSEGREDSKSLTFELLRSGVI